jgi:hypothetical protein
MILKCAHSLSVVSLYTVNTNPRPVTNLVLKQYISFRIAGPDMADCTNEGLFTAFGFKLCCNFTTDVFCVYSVDSSLLLYCITQHSRHRGSTVMTH